MSRPPRSASPRPRRSRSSGARPSWRRLRTLMPGRRGRGRPRGAARRRAGLGQEPPGARVRRRGGGGRRARPLRRLRRRGAHALRAVRRGARPAGARAPSPPSCAPRSARGGGELTRLLPDLGARVGGSPARGRGRPRHRAPPPAHGGGRPARRRHRAQAGAARARGRATGPTPRRCSSCATSRAPAARAHAAARHLPGHRGRRARGARRRRSPTCAATTSSGCGLAGLSGDEVAEFVRSAAGGDAGAGAAPSWRRRSASSPTATRSWSASSGARCGDRGVELRRRRDPDHALAGGAGQPGERPRGREPAALPPRAPHDRPARARGHGGRGVRARRRAPRRRARGARAARRARRGGPQRDDRGAPLAAAGVPLHARAGAAGAVRPAVGAAAGGAPPAGGRGARGAPTGAPAARSPTSRTTSPPPRPSAAPSAPSSTTCSPRGRPPRRSPSTRRRARLRTALALGIDDPPGARGGLARARSASHRGGKALDALEAFAAAADIARELDDAQLLARAAIGYEDACWRPSMPTRARSSCSRRRRRRSARRTARFAWDCWAGWRARSTSRASASAATVVRTNAVDDGAAAGRPRRARHAC